jgi:uncharacterized protein YdeI (YjbR/CyaY-like superfamily)
MEQKNGVATFYAGSRAAWRQWLEENHRTEKSVWLILYKKGSGMPSIATSEAVEEALCFGWVDSLPNKRDERSFYLFFARRNPKSNWSRVNREKVARLMEEGRMAPAGLEMVALARRSGTWTALDAVEEIVLPDDLVQCFAENDAAFQNWEKFPRSSRRGILEWILNAKKPETRQKRIRETVRLAAENIRANHPRQ